MVYICPGGNCTGIAIFFLTKCHIWNTLVYTHSASSYLLTLQAPMGLSAASWSSVGTSLGKSMWWLVLYWPLVYKPFRMIIEGRHWLSKTFASFLEIFFCCVLFANSVAMMFGSVRPFCKDLFIDVVKLLVISGCLTIKHHLNVLCNSVNIPSSPI